MQFRGQKGACARDDWRARIRIARPRPRLSGWEKVIEKLDPSFVPKLIPQIAPVDYTLYPEELETLDKETATILNVLPHLRLLHTAVLRIRMELISKK